jgi:hypothetical protein
MSTGREIMRDQELIRLRPRDLATVWGTAFGQVIDLWRTALTALLEAGSGEAHILGDHCNQLAVRAVGGRPPSLVARNLVGESFGKSLGGHCVRFTEKISGDPGVVLVDCCVDESRGQPIQGDIYRGEVVDERGVLIAQIALDAGS